MKSIYPELEIEKQIGFDFVRNLLKNNCFNIQAKNWVQKLEPFSSFKQYQKRFSETDEFFTIKSNLNKPVIFRQYEPLPLTLESVKVEGYYLALPEIVAIRDFLDLGVAILKRLGSTEVELKYLHGFLGETKNLSSLIISIDTLLDRDGSIKRNASPSLRKLFNRKDQLEKNLLTTLNQEFKKLKNSGQTVDLAPTVKNGRYVIPILSSGRNKVEGVIQGESGSKNISYIEPLVVIQSNNELNIVESEIDNEVRTLLILLSQKIAEHSKEIKYTEKKLAYLEFLNAVYEYNIQFKTILLPLSNGKEVELTDCRHPKLEAHLGKEEIVPLDFKLSEQKRLMIISGPNAGGKSVALKTLSFSQYALQCALPICAAEKSKSIWFDYFLTDVGDNQSMDSDLSTYSAHLTAMKAFLEPKEGNTFIAIDEIGAGTDPHFGGPMAEAMLENFNHQGFFGVITTHFSNLKAMAIPSNNLVNASMLFDTEKLHPMFKLSIGNPGSSFVLELAKRIEIPKKVVQSAKNLAGDDAQQFEQFLSEVDTKKSALHKTEKELVIKQKRLDTLLKEYELLKSNLVKSKNSILAGAKEEATQILSTANQQIEKTVKEIKEKKASKQVVKENKARLEKTKKVLNEKENLSALTIKEISTTKIEWKKGDFASIDGATEAVEITKLRNNKAEVIVNSVKTIVLLSRLFPVEVSVKQAGKNSIREVLMNKMQSFNPKMDLRGKREEEAIFELRNYLDEAYSLGVNQLSIIHGRGTGAIKKATRELLKSLPYIKDWNYEHADRGGDGATIVNLR